MKTRDRNPRSPPDFGIAFGGSGGERESQMPRRTLEDSGFRADSGRGANRPVSPNALASEHPENVPARYPGWQAVIGELHFRLGRHAAAERAWREALRFTTARADREFLRRRLAGCGSDGGELAIE